MPGDPAREEAGARRLQRLVDHRAAVDVAGQATRGFLRYHGECQCLRQAEARRRLAEIDEARRADTLDVATVGSGVEVGLEDVVFRIEQLELHGARRLHDLAARTT